MRTLPLITFTYDWLRCCAVHCSYGGPQLYFWRLDDGDIFIPARIKSAWRAVPQPGDAALSAHALSLCACDDRRSFLRSLLESVLRRAIVFDGVSPFLLNDGNLRVFRSSGYLNIVLLDCGSACSIGWAYFDVIALSNIPPVSDSEASNMSGPQQSGGGYCHYDRTVLRPTFASLIRR